MRLDDFAEINPRVEIHRGRSYPYVAMDSIMPGNRYVASTGERVFDGGGAKFGVGDTLFARITPCLENGKVAQFQGPLGGQGFGSTEFIIFRQREGVSDAGYLFYLSVSDVIRKPAERSMSGASGRQRADLNTVRSLEVPATPLPTQRKIAALLSAYDDLIDNNTRRIAILEAIAHALYREWFVRFRYPGHESVEMVESELGLVPKEWAVEKLQAVADINAASIKKGAEPEAIRYVDIASVSTGRIDKVEPMAYRDAPGRARRLVKHGDLIWSTVRPNRRSYSLILNPPPNLVVSTGFAVISAKDVPNSYLYYALTTDAFASYLTNRAKGAAYPAVSTEDFQDANILLPPIDLLQQFDEAVANMLVLKHNLAHKNALLRRTRDLLLPRLISGEVDVAELNVAGVEE